MNQIKKIFSSVNIKLLQKYKIDLKTKFYMLIVFILSQVDDIYSLEIHEYLEKDIDGFIDWLRISNLMDTLNEIDDLKDFYKTYQKIYIPKSRKIYISMPYHKETEWTYYLIKDVINDISKKLGIEIKDVRTDKESNGVHTGIIETVYDQIDGCSLLIADLTGNNPNVYNEVGYKMGLDKANGIKNPQVIFIVNSKCYYEEFLDPKNSEKDEYEVKGKIVKNDFKKVSFNLSSIKQITFETSEYLKTQLHKELEHYFNYYKIAKVKNDK